MRRLILGVVAAAGTLTSTGAFALMDDPILTRKKLMWANGAAFYGAGQGMVKGEIPFNPVVALSVLQTTNSVAYSFGDYFPEGSAQGDTRASPAIWERMEDFQRYLSEFREKSDAAVAAKPQTLEAFQASIDSLNQTCTQCHDDFRLARN